MPGLGDFCIDAAQVKLLCPLFCVDKLSQASMAKAGYKFLAARVGQGESLLQLLRQLPNRVPGDKLVTLA